MKTKFDINKKQWLTKTTDILPGHDLYYGTPLNKPEAGIPIGDGDMGSLVWLERDGIHINIGKSDLWQDASPGATHDDECFNGSIEEEQTRQKSGGEITVKFDHPAFDYMYQKKFQTRLSLSDASVLIDTETPLGSVSARAFASSDAKTSILRCRMTSIEGDAPVIRLARWGSRTMWRWYSQHTAKAEIGLDGTQSYVSTDRIYITQELNVTKFCLGLALVTKNPVNRTDRKNCHEATITLNREHEHDFTIYYTIRIADTVDAAKAECEKALDQAIAAGEEALFTKHKEDWETFWNVSHISLSDDYLENTYYLYLYYMNSGNRGAYPMRFMHGPWGFYHDFEPWAYYFHFNMQQLFAPLDTAGHGELAQNYYDMRRNSLDTACLFAERYKKRKGAFFHDVTDRYGRGAGYDSDNHTPASQMAMEMWHHYKFTGDRDFLESHALPMMRAAAEYYLNLLELGEDGLYHTYDTCGYEGNYLMDDTITDLAMMRILFRTYRAFADDEMGARIDEVMPKMTEYILTPLELEEDWDGEVITKGIGHGKRPVGDALIYAVGRNKDGSLQRKHRGSGDVSLPEGKCLFPFIEHAPLYPSGDLGLKDRGTVLFEAMTNQMYIAREPKYGGMQWQMTPIFLARMGMADELYMASHDMMDVFQAYPNGFNAEQEEPACKPPFHSPQWYRPTNTDTGVRHKLCPDDFTHFSFETVPVVSKALLESLVQSHEGIIRLCPATPADHAVSFSLFAEGGFRVSAEVSSESYVITIENLLGNDCLLTLPGYANESSLHAYKCTDGELAPITVRKETFGRESVFALRDFAKGDTILLTSTPADELETEIPEKSAPNMQMKECGKAHLGSPALMGW